MAVYKVRWASPFSEEDDSWEPECKINDTDMVQRYWKDNEPGEYTVLNILNHREGSDKNRTDYLVRCAVLCCG